MGLTSTRLALTLPCLAALCLAAPTTGCGRQTPSAATVAPTDPSATAPSATRATPSPGGCVGRVGEYCAFLGGRCSTYEESVERRRSLCPGWVVIASACGRRFRSVSWREPLLGGGEEYFDPAGRLIAAHLYTDYAAYCGGRSFSRTFGTVPTCATKPFEMNLCQRPAPR